VTSRKLLCRGGVWFFVAALPLGFSVACDGKAPLPQGPTTPTSVRSQLEAPPSTSSSAAAASASPAVSTSASTVEAPKPPPPACIVKLATWPAGTEGPKVGADLTSLLARDARDTRDTRDAPMRVPAGATLAMEVVRTGHVVTFTGPAAFRACTPEEPDLVIIATGLVTVEPPAGTKPDAKLAELAVATPGAVAYAGAIPFKLNVGMVTVADVSKPEVIFGTSENGEKHIVGQYKFRRDDSGGLILSRCVVQAASDSATERLQKQIAADAGPPLPSSSVSALAVEAVKHRRLATTDCGVAQAHMLLCDVATADKTEGAEGCLGTYGSAHAEIVKARRPVDLPPGTPFPPGSK
jgi:hypothetical protein